MTDFFISYTKTDEAWAEWVAYVLEEEGFDTVIQAWDFRPGSNFVLEMQQASAAADRTLIVLSPDYLGSRMAAPEWAGAFSQDPQGLERRILPVMVRKCEPKGLLPSLVQIRIMDLSEEEAREKLLAGVRKGRAKPPRRPWFPGTTSPKKELEHKDFPGKSDERLKGSWSVPAVVAVPGAGASIVDLPAASSGTAILIVEDDVSIQALLGSLLRREGFVVFKAGTTAEARKALTAAPVDLVLLDMELPDGNGMDLAREIHGDPGVAIIFLTQRSEPADKIAGLNVGGDDYITKPFDPEEMLARIASVMRRTIARRSTRYLGPS